MKKFFSLMAIAMCAMFLTPSVASAAEVAVMSEQAAPQVQETQDQGVIIIVTDDGIIIIC